MQVQVHLSVSRLACGTSGPNEWTIGPNVGRQTDQTNGPKCWTKLAAGQNGQNDVGSGTRANETLTSGAAKTATVAQLLGRGGADALCDGGVTHVHVGGFYVCKGIHAAGGGGGLSVVHILLAFVSVSDRRVPGTRSVAEGTCV